MARPEKMKIGVIGCGAISEIYLKNMTNHFSILEVKGCSDLIEERSKKHSQEFGVLQMTNDEIYQDPEIEIVLNITSPKSHYEISKAALLAGKHVYSEKMMAVEWDEGMELAAIAKEKGLRLGFAPDTFLGGGGQTARKLVDSGMIGEPLYASALVVRGYQPQWEVNTDPMPFIVGAGGGIPFDMGGYYLHAMIQILGSIKKVTGFGKNNQAEGVFLNPRNPKYKEPAVVETPTILTGTLEFENGTYGSITTIADGFGEKTRLEIIGTEGILRCHDPNLFGKPIYLIRKNENAVPYEMPFTHGYADGDYRGLGVADMAWGIRKNRPHRCSMELGLHTFETIHGLLKSGISNKVYHMTTNCTRPLPLPSGYTIGTMAEACLDHE